LKDAKTFTANFLIDDTFLFENGVRDFDRYRVDPTLVAPRTRRVDLARGRGPAPRWRGRPAKEPGDPRSPYRRKGAAPG
jgi:hypothetical protein